SANETHALESPGILSGGIPWAHELAVAARTFGDLSCVSDGTAELTYRELSAHAAGLASTLRARRIAPGEPVATFLRNGIPAGWASYGVRIAGAAEAPLNPALTEDERRYCVGLIGARHVVTTAAHAPFFAGLGADPLPIEEISPA